MRTPYVLALSCDATKRITLENTQCTARHYSALWPGQNAGCRQRGWHAAAVHSPKGMARGWGVGTQDEKNESTNPTKRRTTPITCHPVPVGRPPPRTCWKEDGVGGVITGPAWAMAYGRTNMPDPMPLLQSKTLVASTLPLPSSATSGTSRLLCSRLVYFSSSCDMRGSAIVDAFLTAGMVWMASSVR